ncbi:hypothetical protein H9P43_008082 [Blastocladiella emersonii ATCC 22665]|nr:hypothetical protein H9P43_008082 [Blastocladiella emersonii ATCC 22665]
MQTKERYAVAGLALLVLVVLMFQYSAPAGTASARVYPVPLKEKVLSATARPDSDELQRSNATTEASPGDRISHNITAAPTPPPPPPVVRSHPLTLAAAALDEWAEAHARNATDAQWPLPKVVHSKWSAGRALPSKAQACVDRWKAMNPGTAVLLWTDADADDFVQRYHPAVWPVYRDVPRAIMRADLFRVLVVYTFGGVWADVDACPLKPMREWPVQRGDQLVVGVEADMESDTWPQHFARRFQFCTWTFAAAPAHPAIANILHLSLTTILRRRVPGTGAAGEAPQWDPPVTDNDVLDLTGPGIFTDGVFPYLGRFGDTSFAAMHFMEAPRRFGDAVVLPLWQFSPGSWQALTSRPSYSRSDADPDALIKHLFLGSWRNGGA